MTTVAVAAKGLPTDIHDHGISCDSNCVRERRPLSVWQRVLLDTDGTVTHLLELYANEPIVIERVMPVFPTDTQVPHSADSGTRAVQLTGQRSKRIFVYAESRIDYDKLDPRLRDALTGTDEPIGRLLARWRTETYREIEKIWCEPLAPLSHIFPESDDACLLARSYRIVSRGEAIMRIYERFPCTLFSLPSPETNWGRK